MTAGTDEVLGELRRFRWVPALIGVSMLMLGFGLRRIEPAT
jgi:hypothetical protein